MFCTRCLSPSSSKAGLMYLQYFFGHITLKFWWFLSQTSKLIFNFTIKIEKKLNGENRFCIQWYTTVLHSLLLNYGGRKYYHAFLVYNLYFDVMNTLIMWCMFITHISRRHKLIHCITCRFLSRRKNTSWQSSLTYLSSVLLLHKKVVRCMDQQVPSEVCQII